MTLKCIWLEPECTHASERAWCEDDPGCCDDCGEPSVKFVLAATPERGTGAGEQTARKPVDRDYLRKLLCVAFQRIVNVELTMSQHRELADVLINLIERHGRGAGGRPRAMMKPWKNMAGRIQRRHKAKYGMTGIAAGVMVTTHCGLSGLCLMSEHGYKTSGGRKFWAMKTWRQTDCKSCLRRQP